METGHGHLQQSMSLFTWIQFNALQGE